MSRAPRRSPSFPLATLALLLAVAAPAGAITVTSLADSGAGTLREALGLANSDGMPTYIDFAPGLAGGTIHLDTPLPSLFEDGTTIDADLGGDCVPDIALDGQWQPNANGIDISSNGNRVAGLAIHSFDCSGCGGDLVSISNADGNIVECNYLGTDLSGTNPLGTSTHPVKIINGSNGNVVRRNLVVFNGNSICVEQGSDNTIGPDNVITQQGSDGVEIREVTGPGYPDFAPPLSPDSVAVYPILDFSSQNGCGPFQNSDATVPLDGGGQPFVVSFGSRFSGSVTVGTPGSYGFEIEHDDWIRLRIDGATVLDLETVGTDSVAVDLTGVHTLELDHVQFPGPARLRLAISGPGSALLSSDANLGGCIASQPGLCGELFQLRVPSEGNTITRNRIFANGGEGIVLRRCGNPPNDPGDLDQGPNTLLNRPLITGVSWTGTPGSYDVWGTAAPSSTVEIFLADSDPSGYGEGRDWLVSTPSDAGGAFSTAVALVPGSNLLTATVTDPAGNTSPFSLNFAVSSGQDGAAVAVTPGSYPGQSLVVPVFGRDAGLTPLGMDRLAGERIQSLSYKVIFDPASSVASKLFARAGITAGLTPIFQSTPTTATTASYLGTFDEATNLIPFTLDAPAPGDQVLQINVTLAAIAPAGTIALTVDPTATLFANQAGSLEETPANGWLALADGAITVLSNAASGLYARATSSSSIQLTWTDPDANETGFRLERSTDSASWATVTTLGANATSYLDATGLSPATLYYYRLVTLIPADSQVSNLAAASTFPALAAKVCATRISAPRTWARVPSAAWDGAAWGVAWQGREDGFEDDVWFQRFAATTLAPIGSPRRVSATGADAVVTALRRSLPVLAWNGARYGLMWSEFLPGEPGIPAAFTTFFALLDGAGDRLRGDVRIPTARTQHPYEAGQAPDLAWDGTHWGLFGIETTAGTLPDLVYRRLDADGDQVTGPVTVVAPATASVSDVGAAWNAAASKYGVAWFEIQDTTNVLYFQRVEESTGIAEGSKVELGRYDGIYGTYGHAVVADGAGWAVAWSAPQGDETSPTFLARLDSTGSLIAPPVRLSDDPPAQPGESSPLLARKPGGGFAPVGTCYPGTDAVISRLEADADGNRVGAATMMTPDDDHPSGLADVASNGSDFLLAWNDQATSTLEVAGLLVPLADGSPPGAVEPLTSGHGPGNSAGMPGPGSMTVFPLGAGFGAVWTDPVSGYNLIQAHTWDGAGATIAALSPLTPTPSRGKPAVVGVGGELAVAWRDVATTDLWFARYDTSGAPVVAERSVSTLGTTTQVAMAFSGEHYGLVWPRGGGLNFLRVAPDGTPAGSDLLVPVGGCQRPSIQWVGTGWAVVWLAAGEFPHYTLLAADGAPVILDVSLGGQVESVNSYSLLWTGQHLALAWAERPGYADPPLEEIYFMRFGLDGSVAVPAELVVSGPASDRSPMLYWAGGTFHLIHTLWGAAGSREIEIQTDGTVLPGSRFWDHRGNPAGAVHNGATLAFGFAAANNLFFETGACVADASPPPCPSLAASSLAGQVHLSWPAVSDPDSGILEYHVYRDGMALADVLAPGTTFGDGGYVVGTTHVYQVRALNGAFNESDGCPTLSFSTTAGDANGNGALEVADIFYLINFFFADGPPPRGDADANGDGGVTVTDIFYLINYFFSGGPPPAWIGEESREVPGGAR